MRTLDDLNRLIDAVATEELTLAVCAYWHKTMIGVKPTKQCIDPTFIGSAIYATINGESFKLSKLKHLEIYWSGVIRFETLNTFYVGVFSDYKLRNAFVENCNRVLRC